MMSLRRLTLSVTLPLIILVTLFPSYVKADTTLTSEFVEPVKNWSFEDRDESIPGNGVYECMSVRLGNLTVAGGICEVTSIQMKATVIATIMTCSLADAYGSQPGDSNWNPNCDLNGNGHVDYDDLFTLSDDYGKTANSVDGAYSWYTSGGDYQMWQWLDSDAVQAVAGRKVTFGFWFLPEFITSGSESDPLGQATSTSGWFLATELTYTPPSGKSVILSKVQLDVYVDDGKGYYKITYQKAGEAETTLVPDQLVTNTEQETRTHDVFVWGEEGQSITVYFYIGRYQGSGMIWSRNHYMYYKVPEMSARAEIYYEYDGGSNTVYGTWVTPTDIEWWNAYVNASLPVSTTAVKVIIHGKPNFKAWVDSASLVISILTPTFDTGKGRLTLGINIYEWRKRPGFDPDGIVSLVPALYTEASGDYKIRWIRLKVELLPNDGSSTTQDGFLNIYYCQQENNEDHEVDPAMQEEVQTRNLETGATVIRFSTGLVYGIVFGVATAGVGTAILPVMLKSFLSSRTSYMVGSSLVELLYAYASDPNVRNAGPPTQPYYVLEKWTYPTLLIYDTTPLVESAVGQFSLDWTFDTASATTFEIQITATVNWGEVVLVDLGGGVWAYELQDAGTYSSVTYITINS